MRKRLIRHLEWLHMIRFLALATATHLSHTHLNKQRKENTRNKTLTKIQYRWSGADQTSILIDLHYHSMQLELIIPCPITDWSSCRARTERLTRRPPAIGVFWNCEHSTLTRPAECDLSGSFSVRMCRSNGMPTSESLPCSRRSGSPDITRPYIGWSVTGRLGGVGIEGQRNLIFGKRV